LLVFILESLSDNSYFISS